MIDDFFGLASLHAHLPTVFRRCILLLQLLFRHLLHFLEVELTEAFLLGRFLNCLLHLLLMMHSQLLNVFLYLGPPTREERLLLGQVLHEVHQILHITPTIQ